MGIFLFPSPTTGLSTRELMVQQVNVRYFRQQGADVRDFACDFLIEVDNLDFNEVVLISSTKTTTKIFPMSRFSQESQFVVD